MAFWQHEMCCALCQWKILGPIFFENDTINEPEYLDLLKKIILLQLDGDFCFQQCGAPPHWALNVRAYLNEELPDRWIGRADGRNTDEMAAQLAGPEPYRLLFLVVQGQGMCPPLPRRIKEFLMRIKAAA